MRLSLIAAAAFLLISCSDPSAPADDLVVTASVAPSVLRPDEIAQVVVTITNRGSRTHSVRRSTCHASFVVSTEDGTFVGPPEPQICALIALAPTELRRGEELVMPTQWWVAGDVSPGTYLLRGSVLAIGQDDPVTSPPVPVLVRQ